MALLWFELVGEDASASSRVYRMILLLWHVQGYRETNHSPPASFLLIITMPSKLHEHEHEHIGILVLVSLAYWYTGRVV